MSGVVGKPAMLGNGYCMAPAKVMLPGFQTAQEATNCLIYLFKDVIIDSDVKYAWAIFGCFLLAFSAEAIRFLRARIRERRPAKAGDGHTFPPHLYHYAAFVLAESLAFGLQMTVAYWLMLIVMTYEWVFMLCIVVGLSIGWFVNEMMMIMFLGGAPVVAEGKGQLMSSGDACCELGDVHIK